MIRLFLRYEFFNYDIIKFNQNVKEGVYSKHSNLEIISL